MSHYDDETPGPVVVGRIAYDVGMKLETEGKAGGRGPAFETARHKALKCRAAGDAQGAAFWEEVFNFLTWRESVAAGAARSVIDRFWAGSVSLSTR